MKKVIAIALALVLLVTAGMGTVAAAGESQPSSKATAKMGNAAWLENQGVWTPILSQSIKTASQKDLFIDAALQCGIYTETVVRSKDMVRDSSKAVGTISVRVKVLDSSGKLVAYAMPPLPGNEADGVIYASRAQTLWAVLQGQVDLTTTETGAYDIVVVAPEEIGLILDTMDAHAFNFVVGDLPSGVYTVVVEAKLDASTELGGSALGSAVADAAIGLGTVTIESVRMIKGEDYAVLD